MTRGAGVAVSEGRMESLTGMPVLDCTHIMAMVKTSIIRTSGPNPNSGNGKTRTRMQGIILSELENRVIHGALTSCGKGHRG